MSTNEKELAAQVFIGGGEMGARMREMVWADTPLGAVSGWSQSLKTAVGIMLNSRFPMVIWWGRELVLLYNDGWQPILGINKDKFALGSRGKDVWSEIWDVLNPMFTHVLDTGEATWTNDGLLPVNRYGFIEEAYFTWSYSPIRDDDGKIGGVFTAVIETTQRVIGERRLKTLSELGERNIAEAQTPADACRVAAETIAKNPYDFPFAAIYFLDESRTQAAVYETVRLEPETAPKTVVLGDENSNIWNFQHVLHSNGSVVIKDLIKKFGKLSGGAWSESPDCAIVLPIVRTGIQDSPAGFVVIGLSPRLEFDKEYRGFVNLVAGQLETAQMRCQAAVDAHAVSESEERYQTLFNSIDEGFSLVEMIFDENKNPLDYTFLEVNPTFEKQTGLVEAAGKTVRELIPNLEAHWFETYGKVALTGEPIRFINGSEALQRWFDVYAFRVGGDDSSKVGIIFNDITSRKKIELERERFFAVSSDLQVKTGTNGYFKWVSPSFERVLGWTQEEMTSQPWTHFVHPDDVPKSETETDNLFEGSKTFSFENRYRHKNGSYRWFLWNALSVSEENVIYGGAIDITQRKMAEEKLRESEERFAKAFNSSPLVVTISSLIDGKLIEVNDTFVTATGFSRAETIGRTTLELGLWAKSEDRTEELETVRRNGQVREVEYSFRTKSGGEIIGLLSAEQIEIGGESYTLSVIQDITNRKQAEIALRESREMLGLAMRSSRMGAWKRDLKTDAVEWNVELEEIFGLPPGTFGGTLNGFNDFVLDEDKSRIRAEIAAAIANRTDYTIEFRFYHADGSIRWMEGRGQAVYDDNGVPLQLYGIGIDINERKRAEAILRDSEERLRLAAETAALGTWDFDYHLQRMIWSERLFEIFGLANDADNQITLERYLQFVHPEDAETAFAETQFARQNRQTYRSEYRIVRADTGEIRWISATAQFFYDETTSEPVRAVGIAQDITARKHSEQALRESEERYRIVAETASDAIISIDEDSKILFVNRAAETIFGYKTAEMVGNSLVMLIPDYLRSRHHSGLSRYVETGQRHISWQNVEVPALHRDGREFPLEISFGEYNHGGTRIFIGIARDITDRKQAEAERERLLKVEQNLRQAAEEANRLKDEFLATVSHELRTPLNAILGWSAIARQSQTNPEMVSRALAVIERNGRNQNQIISDLLDVSRIITGKLNLDVQLLILQPLIEIAVETQRPATNAKNIRLKIDFEPYSELVYGDMARLQQIIWNLLSNAVKFTPENGEITIAHRKQAGYAEVSITDTGEGIEPEFLAFVFDRFRQEEGAENRRHGGLGLGLSIVRNLIEMHGGTIKVESEGKGRGATFSFRLPIFSEDSITNNSPSDSEAKKQLLTGLNILVVDDELEAAEMVRIILEKRGALVTTANSAADALKFLSENTPDVLISDIGMPQADGYFLLREIRSRNSKIAAIPAVALTAYARPEDREHALREGYQAHLAKPVEADKLIEILASLTAYNSN